MNRRWLALAHGAVAALSVGSFASGDTLIELDASSVTPLELFTTDDNDLYDIGRGVLFTADSSFTVNGADLFTTPDGGLDATFELYELNTTAGGDILADATLLRSASATLMGGLGFHGTTFDPVRLEGGQDYLIRVSYDEDAAQNWFFDYDQSGDPPVDLGPVTVIDGETNGSTGNTVMPFMALRANPAIKNFKRQKGQAAGGNTDSLRESDDDTLDINAQNGAKFRTKLQVTINSPCDDVSRLDLIVELGSDRSGVKTRVQLFDFDANRFTKIDTFVQSVGETSRFYGDLSDPDRFIEDGTGKIKVRIASLSRDGDYIFSHDLVEVNIED